MSTRHLPHPRRRRGDSLTLVARAACVAACVFGTLATVWLAIVMVRYGAPFFAAWSGLLALGFAGSAWSIGRPS